jgi:hypothetical protein
MKKRLLILLFSIVPTYFISPALPPVAEVFQGMSEEDIIKQVQDAEKFLQDLQQFGTPEEQAQFNKILEETLNSMSEQDFQDIQNIAKMVEPHLVPDQTSKPLPVEPVQKSKEEPIQKASEDALENVKTLITSIIARIDEILQKFDSSRMCKEEVDTRWQNRATLNSLKRQIAQLRTNRLAEKLSKKDLSEEDKVLLDTLEKFLKEITYENNDLVIEDTFGLSENKSQEEKYLKQAKNILSLFDEYIEKLLPKLEKFFTKWDPEAVQLAKEAAAKTTNAQKEALDALNRKPSSPASPSQKNPYPVQQGSNNSYGSQGYYPEYYDQYGYPQGGGGNYYGASDKGGGSSASKGGSSNPSASSTGKGQTPVQQINQKLKNPDTNNMDDFKEAIDSYFEKYDAGAERSNIEFLDKTVTKGYVALYDDLEKSFNQNPNPKTGVSNSNTEGFDVWFNTIWAPYSTGIIKTLDTDQKKFIHELKSSAPRLCEDIRSAINDMATDEVKKVTPHLDRLEKRFVTYRDSFEKAITAMTETYNKNIQAITSPNRIPVASDTQGKKKLYDDAHNAFITNLRSEIGDKLNTVLSSIDDLKGKVRHKSKRKSKSSALSQNAQQVNVVQQQPSVAA